MLLSADVRFSLSADATCEAAVSWLCAAEIFLRPPRVTRFAGKDVSALLETTGAVSGVEEKRGRTQRVEIRETFYVFEFLQEVVAEHEGLEHVERLNDGGHARELAVAGVEHCARQRQERNLATHQTAGSAPRFRPTRPRPKDHSPPP